MDKRKVLRNPRAQKPRAEGGQNCGGGFVRRGAAALPAFALCTICAIFAAALASCGKGGNAGKADAKSARYSIVAASFPCYDFARAVLGEADAELSLLIKPGAEVHSYDPTPADIAKIQNADLFLFIGGESDAWVEKVLESFAGNGGKSPACFRFIDAVQTEPEARGIDEQRKALSVHAEREDGGGAFHSGEAHGSHGEGEEPDEHIWTSPNNAAIMVYSIAHAICQACPALNAEEIDANAQDYFEKIMEVAERTRAVVDAAEQKYIVMVDRFPLKYFADYYGLEYSAAFAGCSTAVEASNATVAKLIDTVKARGLPAVFYIELTNHKLADVVAESAGVPALMLYSLQNVSRRDFENGETWVSLMAKNAETLRQGLR